MASIAWSQQIPSLSSGHAFRRRKTVSQLDRRAIRAFDIVASLVLLMFLTPLMLLIAILVSATDPGPAIFGHRRLGFQGHPFRCLKFRSMVVNSQERLAHLLATDASARAEWQRDHKLMNDPRITPIGAFLRKSSLDELPQIFNVLRGEMSLVGPRPIVVEEVWRYGRHFEKYVQVRPGITGLWQVSGRSKTSYRRRIAMDVAYARAQSFGFNLKILMMTIPSVLLARGSY